MDIFELYKKKERFTTKEKSFLKSKIKKSDFKIRYGFYRGVSSKGLQIAFVIDSMPNSPRRSGVENKWEIICTREISNIEYDEEIENYGCNVHRFKVFYYRDIGKLIEDDKKYYVTTPENFVKECIRRGYNGNYQKQIDFIEYEKDEQNGADS
jgi:hypothetical protein